jgi:heat shock protein HslJ
LREDFVYFLRMTYAEDGPHSNFDQIGVWTLSADKTALILRSGREASLIFAFTAAGNLRKIDQEDQPITSRLNHYLTITEEPSSLQPRLFLQGMYAQFGDTGTLVECITQMQLPIQRKGDSAALEAIYQRTRTVPGKELLVSLRGEIVLGPESASQPQHEVLVVEKFIDISAEEKCSDPPTTAKLQDTDWKFVRFGNQSLGAEFGDREMYLRLRSDGHGMRAFDGCNRIIGRYELKEQKLRFVHIGTTQWPCATAAVENRRFLKVFESSARWNILGESLELFDDGNQLLATFETASVK